MGGGGSAGYSSSGKGGSGGKGNMGTVEAIMNPVGYVIPETRKWDPVTSLVAPKIDKVLGTEAGNKQYEQQWKDYYAQSANIEKAKDLSQYHKTGQTAQAERRVAPKPKQTTSLLTEDDE